MNFIRTAIAALVSAGATDLGVLRRLQEASSERDFTTTLDEATLLARPSHRHARLAPLAGSMSVVGASRFALDEDDLLARPSHRHARLAPLAGSMSVVGASRFALAEAKRQRKNLKRIRDWARSDSGYYLKEPQ